MFFDRLKYFFARLFFRFSKCKSAHVPADFIRDHKFVLPDFMLRDISGNPFSVTDHKGKRLLLVNVASQCGFTPQYRELQKLHSSGRFFIIGFPCNDFGAQESGSEAQIQSFCSRNYNVTFPLMQKVNIRKEPVHELYEWLSDPTKNGWNSQKPDWNFCKYEIDEAGFLVAYYPSQEIPW